MIRIVMCSLLLISLSLNANIYKYQDTEGRWHFTDKSAASEKIEKIEYKSSKPKEEKFRLFTQTETNHQPWLMAENKFYVSVQLSIKVDGADQNWLVEARTTKKIRPLKNGNHSFNYAWYLGDPNAIPASQEYRFPIDISACPQITQSFNGRFSHQNIQNKFAVDIGANVGTAILAARDGVVIAVKDDYALGGVDDFFMDKANFVQVLHEDGTWALYAHILLGSAVVKEGGAVKTGDKLAKSGSSGYSSGPHLHFVIQKNTGLKAESIPFQFKTPKGKLVVPNYAQKLCEI